MRIAEGPVELFLKAFVIGAGLTMGSFAAAVVIFVGLAMIGYDPESRLPSPIPSWNE